MCPGRLGLVDHNGLIYNFANDSASKTLFYKQTEESKKPNDQQIRSIH